MWGKRRNGFGVKRSCKLHLLPTAMPSLQVPSAPTPSALSKFTTRDKLLLAQAVHELGDEPPEWGKVASLMLAHPVVRDPTRLEEVQAAGITIGRVFGTRECERAWTALMRQRGLVLQPGEVGAAKNPAVEARNRKEARGAPPRTDKKSQLALAQLLYAERMEEIKESLRGKEMQYKSLLTYISSLQAGTLDEVLAEELRAEALSASSRGEGRGERTRSGASSTSALALGKRGSSSNILDSDLNDSFGGESSADSILTATGRKRRAAAALAATNVASPGTPSSSKDQISKDDTAKDKDLNISPGRANRKDRADSRASGSNIDIGEAMEMDRNEEESESRPSSSRGLNKRKRGTDEGEGENENGDEGKGQDEVEGNDEEAEKEGSSPKKAKRDEVDQDEENGDDEEVVEVSAPKNRSTRSSARGGSSIRQDQEETEDIDQDANTETSRNNRISLSPVSSRGGGNSKEKDASNPRTSSRLRGDSTAAGTSTPKTRARNGSNASVSSVANAANKSNDGNNIISPPSGRTTRAGGSTGRNSVPNSEKGKEKEKEKTEEKKRKEKVLLMLWQEVAGHRNANIFQDSVKEGDAPDYYTLIRHPIDLKQIKASIKSGSISSITQLKRSLNQMFANALVYNKEGSDVHNFAEEMRKDVEEILEKHETDQPSSRR